MVVSNTRKYYTLWRWGIIGFLAGLIGRTAVTTESVALSTERLGDRTESGKSALSKYLLRHLNQEKLIFFRSIYVLPSNYLQEYHSIRSPPASRLNSTSNLLRGDESSETLLATDSTKCDFDLISSWLLLEFCCSASHNAAAGIDHYALSQMYRGVLCACSPRGMIRICHITVPVKSSRRYYHGPFGRHFISGYSL